MERNAKRISGSGGKPSAEPYAARAWPRAELDPAARTGLVLLGMGGPDGPEDVEPFLRNLFADPAVLPLPRWLASLVGRLIVRRRATVVRDRYRQVGFGGGSPQLHWTRQQAQRLAELLAAHGLAVEAACAMRYWHPFADETIPNLLGRDVAQIIVVPTYPQYATATTGSALTAFCREAARLAPHVPLHVVPEWHRLPGYIAALVNRATKILRGWIARDVDPRECALLFAAHSLPVRFVRGGDPYAAQTRTTVDQVHTRVRQALTTDMGWLDETAGGREVLLAFQSKVGPVRWLEPELEKEARNLVRSGRRRLALVPVSFTCEHIETVHELDQELAGLLSAAGLEELQRAPALNLDDTWLNGLAEHLRARAFGPQLVGSEGILGEEP